MQSRGREGASSRRNRIAEVLMVAMILSPLAGCTSMAPGIQFARAPAVSSGSDEHPRTEICIITPELVQQERQLRDQQVSEDISDLLQPSQVYRIEAGDVLQIVVWDHPELSASMLPAPVLGAPVGAGVAASPMQPQSGFEVDQQGMLDFPYAGKLPVAGLSATEVHQQLTERLARYLRNPKLSVRVLAYRSKRVYVDGEVKQPGVQAINDQPMTLTEAINRAGGLNPTANQSRITISRDGKTYHINLPQLVQRGVDAGFFAHFTPCRLGQRFIQRIQTAGDRLPEAGPERALHHQDFQRRGVYHHQYRAGNLVGHDRQAVAPKKQ